MQVLEFMSLGSSIAATGLSLISDIISLFTLFM